MDRQTAAEDERVTCPNCSRLQQTADQRWVELQTLRARVMGLESVVAEYAWLVSENAASEIEQAEWVTRLDRVKARGQELLNLAPGLEPPVSLPEPAGPYQAHQGGQALADSG